MENFEESLKARIQTELNPPLQTISEETSEDILSSMVRSVIYSTQVITVAVCIN